ncbi:MAG: ABC transporter permease [Defluviitaleaceae bacterium]|nr:ABC transporter permease [Defluviitaleaceae bacterium]
MQFKYNFLGFLRNKSFLFWTLAFPILLATFFHFAFGGGLLAEVEPVPIVILQENDTHAILNEVLQSISNGENAVVEIIPAQNIGEAEQLMLDGEIDGIFVLGYEVELVVSGLGGGIRRINQSILQSIANEYMWQSAVITAVAAENPAAIPAIIQELTTGINILNQTERPEANLVTLLFYALLAMVCVMATQVGISAGSAIQAGQSALAARRTVAPTTKASLVLNTFLAASAIHAIVTGIVMAYITLVIGISFGDQLHLVLLMCLVGTIMGASLGLFIAAVVKGKESFKESIATAVTFVLMGAGGLFSADIRIAVRNMVPAFDRFNPIALISDGFTSLMLFDTLDFFFTNILILLGISAVLIVVSAAILRRGKYADS